MREGTAFLFSGRYRVQSKRVGSLSRIAGRWAHLQPSDPDMSSINDMLKLDPQWRGEAVVNIRPAFIEQRKGEFAAEPDILYKRSHFERSDGSDPMPSDIIDVRKAATRWEARRPYVCRLFGDPVKREVDDRIGNVERIASIEYYFHEAGHCLGYDTARKYREGYFQIRGRTIWPLVYVEEFKADLLSFGLAASYLPCDTAAALFLYNVMLRLGSHLEGRDQRGCHPYGAIPFLLFASLRRTGFIQRPLQAECGFALAMISLARDEIVRHMRALGEMARSALIEPESLDATEAALLAANFYRSLLEQDTVDWFDEVSAPPSAN